VTEDAVLLFTETVEILESITVEDSALITAEDVEGNASYVSYSVLVATTEFDSYDAAVT